MNRRVTLFWIWLAVTVAVTVSSLIVYRSITRLPDFAGRTDPEIIWEDPAALFADPGLLGTAVEMRVTEAVRACMEQAGQPFRGPTAAESMLDLLDPETDGYGIAAGGETPRPTLGGGGPSTGNRDAYETALYGAPLSVDSPGGSGCAGIGYQALLNAVYTLETLPYSIDQLEADALADPEYIAALAEWVDCMAERGYSSTSPEKLISAQVELLATLGGEDARALGASERRIAADDFACRRRSLDPATLEVVERLAPVFVERNRVQLEGLIPRSGGPELPPGLGSGDVQVTLIWNSTADLDLAVTDPSLDRVYYGNRTVASGGTLDRDANFPCNSDQSSPAVENIYWPSGGAPTGDYRVSVMYTSDCSGEGAQTFDLIVQVGGRVIHQQQYSVTSPGETVEFEFRGGST